jgi:hypothetical protein
MKRSMLRDVLLILAVPALILAIEWISPSHPPVDAGNPDMIGRAAVAPVEPLPGVETGTMSARMIKD